MDGLLHGLDHLGREIPAMLDLRQQAIHVLPLRQRTGEDIRGGHGILDGKVDADPADRRHGVRGIADGKQPGAPPAVQPVERDGQQFDLIPVGQRRHDRLASSGAARATSSRKAWAARHRGSRRPRPCDHVGTLPIVAAVDLHDQRARTEGAAGNVGRQSSPSADETITRRSALRGQSSEGRLVPQDRASAVRGDGEPRPHFLAILRRTPVTVPPSISRSTTSACMRSEKVG